MQQFEHPGFALDGVVGIVYLPARASPAPKNQAVATTARVDDFKRAVDVPAAQAQTTSRHDPAPEASHFGHPQHGPIG